MKQVFVIHGGTCGFKDYEDFIRLLEEKTVDPEYFDYRDWKANLPVALGKHYQVIQPRMPNKDNAHYREWKIWFEKHIPFIHDNVILIGHSLGGIFLAKYLSENDFPKTIAATLLVAAPFERGGTGEWERMMNEFLLPESLEKMNQQVGKIFLYHSKDDYHVPFTELAKYQSELPNATARIFEDRGHFNQEQFPELVADLTSL